MKILHFLGRSALPQHPEDGATGGTTRVALELARAQQARGHDAWVATVGRSAWVGEWQGVKLAMLRHADWAARGRFRGGALDCGVHVPLVRFCLAHRFDVVDAHEYRFLGLLPVKARIVHVHNNPFWSESTPDQWWYQGFEFRLMLGFSDRRIAVSEHVARQLRAAVAAALPNNMRALRRAEQADVVHNGIDVRRFALDDLDERRSRLRSRWGVPPDAVVFLFAGAIAPEKGVVHLARAFVRLAGERPSVRLAIAGGAALWGNDFAAARATDIAYEAVVREILQSDLAARQVLHLGLVPAAQMVDVYAAADAIVLPSLHEASSLVVMEASAVGRPIVATAVGGIPELLTERSAMLVPPEDPDALYDAMRTLAEQPELREALAADAREDMRGRTWQRVADEIDAIVARLLGN